jgi:hypothetical protein
MESRKRTWGFGIRDRCCHNTIKRHSIIFAGFHFFEAVARSESVGLVPESEVPQASGEMVYPFGNRLNSVEVNVKISIKLRSCVELFGLIGKKTK